MIHSGKIWNFYFVPVLILIFPGIFFLFACQRNDPYVLVPDRTTDLVVGSSVQIEDVVVGEVEEIRSLETFPGNQVIRISIDREYSIPSNSRIRIVRKDKDPEIVLQIVVIASKSYYRPGDTLFFSLPMQKEAVPDTLKQVHSGLEYRVQVFASNTSKSHDSPFFKGVQEIDEVYDGTLYKYYAGRAKTLEEAKQLQKEIKERGIKDAFIVAFRNGERISLEQAAKYEK